MWTKAFWKTTGELVVRGAVLAVAVVWTNGVDVLSGNDWKEVGVAAVTGAVGSLIMSLASAKVGTNKDSPVVTADVP